MARKASAEVDPQLAAACKAHGVDPSKVLDWKAYDDRVVFIVEDGRTLQHPDTSETRSWLAVCSWLRSRRNQRTIGRLRRL